MIGAGGAFIEVDGEVLLHETMNGTDVHLVEDYFKEHDVGYYLESNDFNYFYESPYRLVAFLKNALEVLGDRRTVVANDLTKKFERISRGSLSEIIPIFENAPIKGEFVVCITGFEEQKTKSLAD